MNRIVSRDDLVFWLRTAAIRLLAGGAFLGVLGGSVLEAGSVFMKNGYIIQGPIVDQDDNMVVLGWPNGKVFIYRRFLEVVVLEPDEEVALARKKAEEARAVSRPSEGEVVISEGVVEELPATIDELVNQLSPAGAHLPEAHPLAPPGTLTPGNPSGTEVEVAPVPPRPEPTGARQKIPELGISIEPPSGWIREEVAEGVRWIGPHQNDTFAPSLVLISTTVSEWDVAEAQKSLREDPGEMLSDFQVVQEGDWEIHDRTAYQVLGQGHAAAKAGVTKPADGIGTSASSAAISLRQILVPGENRFWLIVAFSSENTSEGDVLALEQAVDSLQFLEEHR